MNELKFRCWDTESKTMGEVSSMCFSEGKIYCVMCNGTECCGIEHGDDGFIMQFTGLHDKIGKDIYDGDIVKYLGLEVSNGKQIYPERRMVVTWDYYELSRLMNIIGNSKARQAEVIGNIHENPELLEREED